MQAGFQLDLYSKESILDIKAQLQEQKAESIANDYIVNAKNWSEQPQSFINLQTKRQGRSSVV